MSFYTEYVQYDTLKYINTDTYKRIKSHKRTHKHTHPYSIIHTHKHTHTHTHIHTDTPTNTHKHPQTRTNTHEHAQTRTNTHTQNTRKHTCTRTYKKWHEIKWSEAADINIESMIFGFSLVWPVTLLILIRWKVSLSVWRWRINGWEVHLIINRQFWCILPALWGLEVEMVWHVNVMEKLAILESNL